MGRAEDVVLMLRLCAIVVMTAVLSGGAAAQVAPTSSEIAQYTGLLAVAARGDAAEIKRLAAGGADVNVRDGYGRTPLHVATYLKNRDAITALIQAGADINAKENDRYDAVTIAAVADDVGTLRMLLQLGASAKQVTSRYDGTALIAAAHLGHDLVVKMLIEAKAPLDHVNNLGWTALIEAIVLGNGGSRHVETLRALVAAGANLNLADRNGQTPLALARAKRYNAMVEILEKAGAK
jgi:ankyrin repeat protein